MLDVIVESSRFQKLLLSVRKATLQLPWMWLLHSHPGSRPPRQSSRDQLCSNISDDRLRKVKGKKTHQSTQTAPECYRIPLQREFWRIGRDRLHQLWPQLSQRHRHRGRRANCMRQRLDHPRRGRSLSQKFVNTVCATPVVRNNLWSSFRAYKEGCR